MAKPKYRLQSLLEIRNRAQQDAARLVATRRAQMAAAEAEMARRQRALSECRAQQQAARAEMFDAAANGIEARDLLRHRTYLADLKTREQGLLIELDEQRAVVVRAAAELDKAIAEFIEASRESLKIEKHREVWSERQRREERRHEQKTQDEMSTATYAGSTPRRRPA